MKKHLQTSWSIIVSKQANEDLQWFRQNDKKLYIKCFDLTLAVLKSPFSGIGKPEPLKGIGANVWSRRVNLEHRMVYEIFDKEIVVAAYRHHYS